MSIAELRLQHFRNLTSAMLSPVTTGLNIISGQNGSGKTSLLEAIYFLSLGRSFRTSTANRLICFEAEKFALFAKINNQNQPVTHLGVERDRTGNTRLRLAEKDVSNMAELAYFLPLNIINSQSHQLFESGPTYRRKYLDWGLFYQQEQFLICWRHYERALKQRNALLRYKHSLSELQAWTNELVTHGIQLHQMRERYLAELLPFLNETIKELLHLEDLRIHYQPGWNDSVDFGTILAHHQQDDLRIGYTQFGPHRADLTVQKNGVPLPHFLSRGQQKLLLCAMILAQGRLFARDTNKNLIYLLDDLPSELDLHSRQKLLHLLSQQNTQIFVTAIESQTICELLEPSPLPLKVFHVEHGRVREMENIAV